MSGIRSGTRLDQLEHLARTVTHHLNAAQRRHDPTQVARLTDLQARLDAAIADEHAQQAAAARRRPGLATAVRAADQTVAQHLARLGVSGYVVKAWALDQGLIPAMYAGRVSRRLVDAYDHAHQQEPA